MKNEHLIFFDHECPLCHRAVRRLIELDTDELFLFAPLNGKTAQDILIGPQKPLTRANSLILAEHYQSTMRKFWVRARALLRVYWLLGQGWELIGILSFLPAKLVDPFYRWMANHRHQFKLKISEKPGPASRFLP